MNLYLHNSLAYTFEGALFGVKWMRKMNYNDTVEWPEPVVNRIWLMTVRPFLDSGPMLVFVEQ